KPALRQPRTSAFYVSPSGSDANDCLSQATSCKTAQVACSKAMNEWDFAGHEPFIRLTAGVHIGGCNLAGQPVGAHTVNMLASKAPIKVARSSKPNASSFAREHPTKQFSISKTWQLACSAASLWKAQLPTVCNAGRHRPVTLHLLNSAAATP